MARPYEASIKKARDRFVAMIGGELVEEVSHIIQGDHSSLCFHPCTGGGNYACCCSPDRYVKAKRVVELVQSALAAKSGG